MAINTEAPMPGKIIDLKVKAGDKVSKDDLLVVLEAMKMENELQAEAGGIVKEINCQVGDFVSTGQVILTIE